MRVRLFPGRFRVEPNHRRWFGAPEKPPDFHSVDRIYIIGLSHEMASINDHPV